MLTIILNLISICFIPVHTASHPQRSSPFPLFDIKADDIVFSYLIYQARDMDKNIFSCFADLNKPKSFGLIKNLTFPIGICIILMSE